LPVISFFLFFFFVPSFTYVVVKCPYMVKEWLACQDCQTDRKVNIWRLAMVIFPCYERTCWPNWENSFFSSDFFDWSFFPLWLTMYGLVCCCPLHARFPPSRRGLAQLVVYYNTFPILYISWISSHAIVS
jgi:hypothetical protein